MVRKLIYALNVSLDGFMEGPDGDLSWSDAGEELHRHFAELDRSMDTHLYGRRLYENMAAFWPQAENDPTAADYEREYGRVWVSVPKVVFSTTLDTVDWNSRLVKGNAAEEVRRLKAEPGGDMSVAGAGLAGSLMQEDLIDEYRMYVHPVLVGGGTRMFPLLQQYIPLELIETQRFNSGVIMLRYQRTASRVL
ncbi:MAG: dihydrofolate reductase family protein [Chloroflexi bacterium]|nr:dihydrofolate reductase family protein [Chloroflexota bacterium]